jgi:SAM-dependent methyltransferase
MALAKPLTLLRAPGNALGFLLRRRLAWSRGECELENENKAGLFAFLDWTERSAAEARERELHARYGLAALHARSSRQHYCENLALLEALERLCTGQELPTRGYGPLRALDVGCGVFQYATALARFLARHSPAGVELRGLEVDAHGIYRDGHARADHARAHARLAGAGVTFESADFLARAWSGLDVVTLFYPFLTRHALLAWGLPLSFFRPHTLLAHAAASLVPGGALVVANQTAEEHQLLRQHAARLPLALVAEASFSSDLVDYAARTDERTGTLWRRT